MILIGFMGAGKTSVAQTLSKSLNIPCYDLDKEIIKKIQMPLSDYFDKYGETQFRKLEHQFLLKYYSIPGVISTGGGCIENHANRAILKETSNVVYLRANFETLRHRIKKNKMNFRPIAKKRTTEELKALYMKRLIYYETCATYTIDTDTLNTQEVSDRIIAMI